MIVAALKFAQDLPAQLLRPSHAVTGTSLKQQVEGPASAGLVLTFMGSGKFLKLAFMKLKLSFHVCQRQKRPSGKVIDFSRSFRLGQAFGIQPADRAIWVAGNLDNDYMGRSVLLLLAQIVLR